VKTLFITRKAFHLSWTGRIAKANRRSRSKTKPYQIESRIACLLGSQNPSE
jgi:hypothetical protein